MLTTRISNSNALLTYSLMTTPAPVPASPASGPPSVVSLTFVISAPIYVGAITVTALVFNLPVGDPTAPDPTDLTENAASISASVTSSSTDQWSVGPGASAGSFIVRPATGQSGVISNQSLTVTFTGIQVGPLVGTATVEIIEASTAAAPQPRQCWVAVPKFPQGFYCLDFTANAGQISSGQSVTLTWQGSTNADYYLSYGDQTNLPVTNVRSWPSPPLYATTAFVLQASATQGGQTVTLNLETVVIVASPDLATYGASPAQIDYNQSTVLNWRAINADGVYFLTGQTGMQTLGPVSDPNNPFIIQPQFGASYALQAFKFNSDGSGPVVSKVYPIAITFNPVDIVSFTANPSTLDGTNPTTTLSWNVAHAKSVAFQGQTVPAQSSQQSTPTDNATYQLAATWVDGSVTTRSVSVTVVKVRVNGVATSFQVNGTTVTVTFTFDVANATSGQVSNAHLMFCNRIHWYIWGTNHQTESQSVATTQLGPTQWQAVLTYNNVPQDWLNDPNIGIGFDYSFAGYLPVSSTGNVQMYKGEFSFWNGS